MVRVFIIIAVLLLDQLTKYLVYFFEPNFFIGFFKLHLVKNTGAAFGILQQNSFYLAILAMGVVVYIILSYDKLAKDKQTQILYAIFLGGVIGNLLDRLILGYVIDFIDFIVWPAFNVADSAMVISVIWLLFKS